MFEKFGFPWSQKLPEKTDKAKGNSEADAEAGASDKPRIVFRAGSVPGKGHTRARINNQDSYVLRFVEIHGARYAIGLVADGCTGKKKLSRTEIGSGLITLYAFSEIRSMLTLGTPLEGIPKALYPRCVSYVGNLARTTIVGTPEEQAMFVNNFCLCTLLGFVMDEQSLVTFSSGDGFIVVNDKDIVIDHDNKPTYLAYHQVDRRILGAAAVSLPTGFDNIEVYQTKDVRQFAVGTDGLLQKDSDGKPFLAPEDREALFSHKPSAPAGLQWFLNKEQNRLGRFDDDTTVIELHTVESEV